VIVIEQFVAAANCSGSVPAPHIFKKSLPSNNMEPILSAHKNGEEHKVSEGLPLLVINGWQMEERVEELD
jgi:hypothetical protein